MVPVYLLRPIMIPSQMQLQPYGSIIRLVGAWILFFSWLISAEINEHYAKLERDVHEVRLQAVLHGLSARLENHLAVSEMLLKSAAPSENFPSAHGLRPSKSPLFQSADEQNCRSIEMFASDLERLASAGAAPQELQLRIASTAASIRLSAPDEKPKEAQSVSASPDRAASETETRPTCSASAAPLLTENDDVSRFVDHELNKRLSLARLARSTAFIFYGIGTALAVFGEWLRRPITK